MFGKRFNLSAPPVGVTAIHNGAVVPTATKSKVGVGANNTNEELERLQIKLRETEKELEEKKAELQILFSIDEIRDECPEPREMFERIVELLNTEFHALFCLLYIADDESGVLDLWGSSCARKETLIGVNNHIKADKLFKWLDEHYDALSRTKEEAVIMILRNKTLPPELQINHSDPVQLVCVQIVLDNKKIGVLVLARETSFSSLEIATLKAANSQIDSSIVQAHNVSSCVVQHTLTVFSRFNNYDLSLSLLILSSLLSLLSLSPHFSPSSLSHLWLHIIFCSLSRCLFLFACCATCSLWTCSCGTKSWRLSTL